MTGKKNQALVLIAAILWLTDIFLFGVLVGCHLHTTSLSQGCSPGTRQIISAFSFSPFRTLPEGGTCV